MGEFILEENNLDLLIQRFKKSLQTIYEKLYAEIAKTGSSERKVNMGFESFFELLIGYIAKNYSDPNCLFKLVLFTDGICIDNTSSVFEVLEQNKFFMSCDIILTGLPESCVSNDFGFIFSKPLLKSLTKILNGKLYTSADFEKLCEFSMLSAEGNQLPAIPEFLRVALGVPQQVKITHPQYKHLSPEQLNKETIKPYRKMRIKV